MAIIRQQEKIVGPLAWRRAGETKGVIVSGEKVKIKGNGEKVLGSLVESYQSLFGQASVEMCRDSVRPLLAEMKNVKLPAILSN